MSMRERLGFRFEGHIRVEKMRERVATKV